jgi:hypothetical protein
MYISRDLWLARVWGPPGDFHLFFDFFDAGVHPFTWGTYTPYQPGLKVFSPPVTMIQNFLHIWEKKIFTQAVFRPLFALVQWTSIPFPKQISQIWFSKGEIKLMIIFFLCLGLVPCTSITTQSFFYKIMIVLALVEIIITWCNFCSPEKWRMEMITIWQFIGQNSYSLTKMCPPYIDKQRPLCNQ